MPPRQALTSRQVLRRRRFVVLAGLLLALLGASTLLVRAGQEAWAVVSGAVDKSDAEAVSAAGQDAPAWIEIPDVDMRHSLVPQGLTEDGTISPDQGQVIWYTGGDRAVPGAEGIAIIAGHVDYHGEPDVFARLHELDPGDLLTIGQVDGEVLDLTVVHMETMSKEQLRHSGLVWSDRTDKRLVALVTCDDALGRRADGHRLANLVVVAEVG